MRVQRMPVEESADVRAHLRIPVFISGTKLSMCLRAALHRSEDILKSCWTSRYSYPLLGDRRSTAVQRGDGGERRSVQVPSEDESGTARDADSAEHRLSKTQAQACSRPPRPTESPTARGECVDASASEEARVGAFGVRLMVLDFSLGLRSPVLAFH